MTMGITWDQMGMNDKGITWACHMNIMKMFLEHENM
jgi:hypothetical protein